MYNYETLQTTYNRIIKIMKEEILPIFHKAVRLPLDQQLTAVKKLIKQGADVQADDNYAFIESIDNGNIELVKYLVKQGADIHARDDWAIQGPSGMGRLEIVEYVISKGVDVNVNNNQAIKWAAERGDLDIVKLLIKHGANVSTLDGRLIYSACANNYFNILKLLFQHGLNIANVGGGALRIASESGNADIVMFLIDKGLNPAFNNSIALKNATSRRSSIDARKKIVRALVKHGADILILDAKEASKIFGSPEKAAKNITQCESVNFIQTIVNRHVKYSKKGILTLMEQADDWIKPYYLSVMSNF